MNLLKDLKENKHNEYRDKELRQIETLGEVSGDYRPDIYNFQNEKFTGHSPRLDTAKEKIVNEKSAQ